MTRAAWLLEDTLQLLLLPEPGVLERLQAVLRLQEQPLNVLGINLQEMQACDGQLDTPSI